MASLIDHLIKLTDHRDRDRLELTLSKALIDLLPLHRVVIARVVSEEGIERWLQIATLDAKGGGKVVDPLRVDFSTLPVLDEFRDRVRCVQTHSTIEVAWAGEEGPRITYIPLFDKVRTEEDGVLEIHSAGSLSDEHVLIIQTVLRVFRNMFNLLAYSDRDGLTGLFNRKSLDDTFYSAVLEELEEGALGVLPRLEAKVQPGQERRHRLDAHLQRGAQR